MNIANAYLAFLCIVMITFILAATLMSYKKTKDIIYFIFLLIVELLILITSSISVLVQAYAGVDGIVISNILTYFSFLGDYVLIFLFGCFLFCIIDKKKKINNAAYIVLTSLTIIGVVFLTISLTVPNLYFYIPTEESISIGKNYYTSHIIGIIIIGMFVLILINYFKYLTKKEIITFLVFEMFPLLSLILGAIFPNIIFSSIIPAFGLLAIYTNIYIESYKSKELELAEHKQMILLSQIRPHFIFNTLSTIKALYMENPSEGERILDSFSTYLRGNINSLSNNELIPFEKELEHTKCYLDIEKTRFGDRLNVVFDIEEKDFLIPSLIIQPISENAVRHGISKKRNGGTVTIKTRLRKNYVQIDVIDDGVGFDASENIKAGHVGVSNIKERIEKYVKGGKVTIKSQKGVGTIVTILIPKR